MHSPLCLVVIVLAVALAAVLPAADGPLLYPPTKKVDHTDEYHGTTGRRPVSLARRRRAHVAGSRRVGRGREQGDRRIPERDPRARRDPQTAHGAVELRAATPPPVQGRRPLLLSRRTTACKTSRCCYTHGSASTARSRGCCSTRTSGPRTARSRCAGTRSISDDGKYLAYGVAEAGSDWNTWHVLDVDHRQAAARRVEVDQVHRRSLDQGQQGLLLQPLRRAASRGRRSEPQPQPEALLSPRRHAAGRRRARLPAAAITRMGALAAQVTEDGRYLIITVGDGTTSRKNRVAYKDLTEALDEPAGRSDRRLRQRIRPSSATTARSSTSRPTTNAPRGRVVAIDTRKPDDGELEGDHPAGEGEPDRRQPGRQPVHRTLPEGRPDAGQDLRAGRQVRPRGGVARHRHGRRVSAASAPTPRRSTPFRSFATPPSIYRYDLITGESTLLAAPKVEVQSRRLRGQAGRSAEQGRHQGADVHHAQEGHEARRQQPDAAVRLRRLQHLADAGVLGQRGWPGWRWAASTPRRTSAAAASTARSGTRPGPSSRSRTSSTTSSPRPSG